MIRMILITRYKNDDGQYDQWHYYNLFFKNSLISKHRLLVDENTRNTICKFLFVKINANSVSSLIIEQVNILCMLGESFIIQKVHSIFLFLKLFQTHFYQDVVFLTSTSAVNSIMEYQPYGFSNEHYSYTRFVFFRNA